MERSSCTRNIFLIGYRATGKTTVGRILAKKLGYGFIDLDALIQGQAGDTIEGIVKRDGWERFRLLEAQALRGLLRACQDMVISCGGGAVLHQDIMATIKKDALIIWLKARPRDIIERIKIDERSSEQRPALSPGRDLKEEITTILEARTPLYQRFSHFAVDTTNRDPAEVATRIARVVGQETDLSQEE